ncbi:MAG: hypothetical protein WDZ74_01710 [Candidatus Paceibacterota bacterium]
MKGYSPHHHAHVVHLNGNLFELAIENLERSIITIHSSEVCFVQRFIFDKLKIGHAREISRTTENRNGKNERRIYFISFSAGTREAQNALLKTLEEPARGTSFILVVPSTDILLETIQSRCITLVLDPPERSRFLFLKTPYKDRLEYIKMLLENKNLLGGFYAGLEQEIAEYVQTRQTGMYMDRALPLALYYKHLVMNHSTSSKYLLEELALRLPFIEEN